MNNGESLLLLCRTRKAKRPPIHRAGVSHVSDDGIGSAYRPVTDLGHLGGALTVCQRKQAQAHS